MQFVGSAATGRKRGIRSGNLLVLGGSDREGAEFSEPFVGARRLRKKQEARGEEGGAVRYGTVGGAVAKGSRSRTIGSGVSESQGNGRGWSAIPKRIVVSGRRRDRSDGIAVLRGEVRLRRRGRKGEGERGKKETELNRGSVGEVVSKKSFPTGREWW